MPRGTVAGTYAWRRGCFQDQFYLVTKEIAEISSMGRPASTSKLGVQKWREARRPLWSCPCPQRLLLVMKIQTLGKMPLLFPLVSAALRAHFYFAYYVVCLTSRNQRGFFYCSIRPDRTRDNITWNFFILLLLFFFLIYDEKRRQKDFGLFKY